MRPVSPVLIQTVRSDFTRMLHETVGKLCTRKLEVAGLVHDLFRRLCFALIGWLVLDLKDFPPTWKKSEALPPSGLLLATQTERIK